jgi:hypothetical protein
MSTKNFFFFGLFAFAVLGFTACESDPCAKKDCGTSGVCDTDGTCICDAGYEYDANGSCSVVTEHKFVGSWNVTDVCATTPNPTTITYSSASIHGTSEVDGKVNITSFGGTAAQGGFLAPIVADVTGTSVTIASQNPDGPESDGSKFFVSGSGTIDETKTPAVMTVAYKIEKQVAGAVTSTLNCTATFKKQ